MSLCFFIAVENSSESKESEISEEMESAEGYKIEGGKNVKRLKMLKCQIQICIQHQTSETWDITCFVLFTYSK